MIEEVLTTFSSSECNFAVQRQNSFISHPGRGTSNNARGLEKLSKDIKDPQRAHEVETHAKALESVSGRGSTISLLTPVDVTQAGGQTVTDIDGLSLTCKQDGLWLLLVEAKDQRVGSVSAAKNQLKDRLKDMGLKAVLDEPQVREISDSGAYVFSALKTS
ncbi:MAG: hypothetical protein KGZ25_02230 [Planctomycetes bacterium]|nr:hypothetical protein [Planctomycetota bacterium]